MLSRPFGIPTWCNKVELEHGLLKIPKFKYQYTGRVFFFFLWHFFQKVQMQMMLSRAQLTFDWILERPERIASDVKKWTLKYLCSMIPYILPKNLTKTAVTTHQCTRSCAQNQLAVTWHTPIYFSGYVSWVWVFWFQEFSQRKHSAQLGILLIDVVNHLVTK